jgi:hypothetical protein
MQWKKLAVLVVAASILLGASLIWSAGHPRPARPALPPFVPGTPALQPPR